MVSRKLDLSTIASTIEKVDMGRAKEVIPSSFSKTGTAITKKQIVSNDIGDILKEHCDSKKLNKRSKDYLANLDRALQLNPDYALCDAVKSLNPLDSVLMKNAKSAGKKDFSDIVKRAVTNEMGKSSLLGNIPDCLLNDIMNKLAKLTNFGGLSLNMRLDLLGLLGDGCVKDMVGGATNYTAEHEATKGIMNGLLTASPSKAYEYMANKAEENPKMAISALESSLNENEGQHTVEKLAAYNRLKNEYGGDVITGNSVSESFINNIDSETNNKAYYGDNFETISESVDNMGGVSSYGMLKGKSNLSNMAKDNLANKVSSDDMSNSVKTTNVSFATATVLSNAF